MTSHGKDSVAQWKWRFDELLRPRMPLGHPTPLFGKHITNAGVFRGLLGGTDDAGHFTGV